MTIIDCSPDTMDHWDSIVRVPAPEASSDSMVEFSHTFDAYGVHGSLERIAMIADDVAAARRAGTLGDCDLDDLRTALFMTQQSWRHDGDDCVDADRLGVEWDLVDAIREASGGVVRDDRPILL